MIKWRWKTFDVLTTDELYALLQLRESVFQLEQQSLYQDCDDVDQQSEHLLGYENNTLTAYLRIYKKPPENNYHIGRIVITKSARGKGLGQQIMQECLGYLEQHHPESTIEMSAQIYLEKFYNAFGFKRVGEPYDDAGVAHIRMMLVE